jgi:hypothetical protein
MKAQLIFLLSASLLVLSACGGGGSGGGGIGNNGVDSDAQLLAELERIFPFTPNQPFDVIYSCARTGSVLEYIFDFKSDGTFDLTITDDTGAFHFQPGTYTYMNNELHLQTGSPAGAILFNLDERSTSITPAMGLIGIFQTPNMICGAIGHRYNDPMAEFGNTVHYDCPSINIQPVSFDVNAIEFVLRTIPFNLAVPGSAFRARDRFISSNPNALIARGYGLYRRVGNKFYILFAAGTFDDYNTLSGDFKNGNLQVSVDQLEPQKGDCSQ